LAKNNDRKCITDDNNDIDNIKCVMDIDQYDNNNDNIINLSIYKYIHNFSNADQLKNVASNNNDIIDLDEINKKKIPKSENNIHYRKIEEPKSKTKNKKYKKLVINVLDKELTYLLQNIKHNF
jgi:hypothetical protein